MTSPSSKWKDRGIRALVACLERPLIGRRRSSGDLMGFSGHGPSANTACRFHVPITLMRCPPLPRRPLRNLSKHALSLILVALVLIRPSSLWAKTEWSAGASFENLNFLIDRGNHGINDNETLEGDFKFTFDNEHSLRAVVHPGVRIDFPDFSRNRYLPNESYLLFYASRLEVEAGLDVISWGVSNSFNPTDLINRRDFEHNFYDPEKMGELLASVKSTFPRAGPVDELTLHFLLLPLFQKAPLPELDSRFPIEGNANGVPYTVSDNQTTPDYPEAVGAARNATPATNSPSTHPAPSVSPPFITRSMPSGETSRSRPPIFSSTSNRFSNRPRQTTRLCMKLRSKRVMLFQLVMPSWFQG